MKLFIILIMATTMATAEEVVSFCQPVPQKQAAEKIQRFQNGGGQPIERFYAAVDGYLYELVNPNCPECIIDGDIQIYLEDWYISIETEFIFKGGFDHAD